MLCSSFPGQKRQNTDRKKLWTPELGTSSSLRCVHFLTLPPANLPFTVFSHHPLYLSLCLLLLLDPVSWIPDSSPPAPLSLLSLTRPILIFSVLSTAQSHTVSPGLPALRLPKCCLHCSLGHFRTPNPPGPMESLLPSCN